MVRAPDADDRRTALQPACLRVRQPGATAAPNLPRDWLRGNPAERDGYAIAKRQAAAAANAAAEHVMQYNARKQQVIREIYHRAFAAAGLLED